MTAGVSIPQKSGPLSDYLKREHWYGNISTSYAFSPRVDIGVQLNYRSARYRSVLRELERSSLLNTFGLRFKRKSNDVIDIFFSEDITPATTLDLGFG